MTERDWKEKRSLQGYGYHDVLAEMKRRRDGERVLDEKKAWRQFEFGVEKLDAAFRFSSRLCDLLSREMLTYEDLQHMAGIRDNDCLLLVLLDPVSCGKPRRSLRNSTEVDKFYPGVDVAKQQ